MEHLARGSFDHVLPGDLSWTHRGGRIKTPHCDTQTPQSAGDYFDFKELVEADRDPERFTRMVRDEGIRIARKLIATGLDPQIQVHLASAQQFFAASPQFHGTEPFPLELLARQQLSAGER